MKIWFYHGVTIYNFNAWSPCIAHKEVITKGYDLNCLRKTLEIYKLAK